jgi:curved DNA-binding protein CbpA
LGLMRGASLREIKRAYFSLVREYPPEEHPDTFKIIRAAYEKLRLTDVKAETDLFLFQSPAPWTPRKRKSKLDLDVHLEDIVWLLQQHGDLGRTDFRIVPLLSVDEKWCMIKSHVFDKQGGDNDQVCSSG